MPNAMPASLARLRRSLLRWYRALVARHLVRKHKRWLAKQHAAGVLPFHSKPRGKP